MPLVPHLVALLTAFVVALVLTPWWTRYLIAQKIALAIPRARDVHHTPTPRLGGLVIVLSFWLVVGGVAVLKPTALGLDAHSSLALGHNLIGVLLGTLILAAAGAYDDLKNLRPGWKLVWQALAALMLPLFQVRVQWLANPLGGANIELSRLLDGVIAVAWIILIINVINFLDGLDGLATGVGSIALAVLTFLSVASFVNQPALALLLLILLGACLGFLPSNWHPAKIFLGDSGSQVIGYLLGVAAIMSGGKLATAGLVLGLPILDALWAIIRRVAAGRSPFTADREHLHQRLYDLGLSQPTVVVILMTIALIFGMIALASRTTGKVYALLAATGLMAILLVSLSLLERFMQKSRSNS